MPPFYRTVIFSKNDVFLPNGQASRIGNKRGVSKRVLHHYELRGHPDLFCLQLFQTETLLVLVSIIQENHDCRLMDSKTDICDGSIPAVRKVPRLPVR